MSGSRSRKRCAFVLMSMATASWFGCTSPVPPISTGRGSVSDATVTANGPDNPVMRPTEPHSEPPTAPHAGTRVQDIEVWHSTPFGEEIRPEHVYEILPDGLHRAAVKISRVRNAFRFDGLAEGPHVFEIDDPRFVRWSASVPQPGQPLYVELEGSASVDLVVDRPMDGASHDSFVLDVRYDTARSSPNTMKAIAKGESGERIHIGDLVPGPLTFIVTSPGMARLELSVVDLAPGENQSLSVHLTPGVRVSGRVLLADGKTPAPGVGVLLLPRGLETAVLALDPNLSADVPLARPRWILTNTHGRFEFDHAAPGSFTLRAWCNAWLAADIATIEIEGEHDIEDLEGRLPPCGRIEGHCSLPTGTVSFADMSLNALPGSATRRFDEVGTSVHGARSTLRKDGSFDLGWITAGRVELSAGLELGTRRLRVDPDHVDLEAGQTLRLELKPRP